MGERRVVTGHDGAGKAVVVADGAPPRTVAPRSIPGMRSTLVWATEPGAPIALDGGDGTAQVASFHPGPGGTRFLLFTFPPDTVYASPGYDAAAAGPESAEAFPGLAERFEPDAPGMHTTDTVDYGIVLQGEPELELDDGARTPLKPGDVVVQNGTRHAWRNPTDAPVVIAFVLVGADR
jgi:mannose-6-phosphate isomerase-like protein (cupin superfamily)